jgi:hypothetical protein
MARRNGNEIQDRLISQMEKMIRNNPTEDDKVTLAEQIKFANASPEEKQKRKTPSDWHQDLVNIICQDKTVHLKLYSWVCVKYKKEIEEFRTKGAPYNEVLVFIRSKNIEFINL